MKAKTKILDSDDFCKLSDNKKKKLIGAKVQTEFLGVGTVAKTDKGRIMVRVTVKCCSGKHRRSAYLTDAFTTGDLANVYSKKGEYSGNLGNDVFKFCDCKHNS